jgi:signal transduction histidine kinase
MGLSSLFAKRSITSIYLIGLSILLAVVLLVTAVALYVEYLNFGKEVAQLRQEYIKEQKEQIHFDTSRVLRFIARTYEQNRGKVEERELQSQILNAVEQLYGRRDGTGYIFIYDFNGTCLSDPVQRQNVGRKLYDFKDPGGVQVIKELIDVSRRPEGGFVRYTWIKPTTGTESPKISYARSFEPWGWMVGTGVYLDEVERVIAAKRAALREKTFRTLFRVLALMALLALIGLLGVMLLNRIIRGEIRRLQRHFDLAAKQHLLIDAGRVRLREFRPMVHSINSMASEIHRRKRRLQEINLSLEKRVSEKTADLRERNEQLAEEKERKEALIRSQDSFIRQSIHEINTPLAVIMTHIDIFKMKHGHNRYLAKIEAAAKMIATIFDDLSYRVKKDRFDYKRQRLNFSEFLEERIRFFDEMAAGNRLRILPGIEPGLEICFSEIELLRIVDNNLSNAIKYAKSSSEILVSLTREGEALILEFVTESRNPIEDTRKIFEAYHREDEEAEGFGLGLVIVSEICKRHGVAVEVSSNEERTIFRYRFKNLGEGECEDRAA